MADEPIMHSSHQGDERARRGFLARLRTDVAGNTLAMMAIWLVPLCALTGSAIDTARMYVVRVRLQQACDAGALAGRKFMNDAGSNLDANATAQANNFFNNNFRPGWLGSHDIAFTPSKSSDNQVQATATAIVPMTIMKMFKAGDATVNVACQARFDVADADIMFVLDTTGSMAQKPDGTGAGAVKSYTRNDGTTGYSVTEASGSKISGLRTAVLNFYDTLKLNADPTTHIRYGFVTYTSTVNAGKAITDVDPGYMVSKWTYPTRRIVGDKVWKTNSTSTTAMTLAACNALYSRNPTTYTATDPTGATYTVYPFDGNGKASAVDVSYNSSTGKCTVNNDTIGPIWRYANYTYDVSQFTATINGNDTVDPSKVTGAKTKWNGCIEERKTTAGTLTFNVNSLPADLDPDLVPFDDDSRWRPMWQDVIYYRGSSSSYDSPGTTTNPYGDYAGSSQMATTSPLTMYNNIASGYVSCGMPVSRLQEMERDDVKTYVNDPSFAPQGGTYHDTGMIWGTRLLAPNGVFKEDTKPWPGRNAPNRYIVFMTDGEMAPNQNIYGMYGLENYDKRVSGGDFGNLDDYHNARFLAECSAAKARNIKVFVVGFGQTLNTQLTQCASPGSAYYASDNASLNTAFANIAKQVAMLRVSK